MNHNGKVLHIIERFLGSQEIDCGKVLNRKRRQTHQTSWTTLTRILTEEDKNKARRAWSDGPNGSIFMGQRKGESIPCIGPLQIEHYIKKGSNKNRAQVLGDSGRGALNQRVLYGGMTCPPRFGFLK